jgi:cyclophilin family peptidyl-prolyl cis-trans isomerase
VQQRSGSWFDPVLTDAFAQVAADAGFWATLASPEVTEAILALEPASNVVALDDDYLDDIAAAFGQVVEGMDIIKRILVMPKSQKADSPAMVGQMLATYVKILSVKRV